jgi:hypothetical protein
MRTVHSERAFGRSGLPRRDWRLFKRPLQSLLCSVQVPKTHTWLVVHNQFAVFLPRWLKMAF